MICKYLRSKLHIFILLCFLPVGLSAQKEASTPQEKELFEAVSKDFQTVAERLLNEEGVDANIITEYGESLLMFAARNNNLELARLLIDKGANPNYRINQTAEYDSNKNAMKMLMLKGLSVMDYAIASKSISMVELLVSAGAKIDFKNKHLNSAVAEASKRNNVQMVRYLLNKGAQVSEDTRYTLVVWHIVMSADPIYGVTPINKKTDFSLVKIWDDYGEPLEDKKLISSQLLRKERDRENVLNYMAAYREWVESGAELVEEASKSAVKPLPRTMNETEIDSMIAKIQEDRRIADAKNEAIIQKEAEEAEQMYKKSFVLVAVILIVGGVAFSQRQRLSAVWVSLTQKWNRPPAPSPVNPPPMRSVRIRPQNRPAANRAPEKVRKPKKSKKSKGRDKLYITEKGWTVDNTVGLEVFYLTIEDMINPIRLKNEHEKAVREMISYFRKVERLSADQITDIFDRKELSTKLNSLWKSIDPVNVRDVYKRSLFILVEHYSDKDKGLQEFLSKNRLRR